MTAATARAGLVRHLRGQGIADERVLEVIGTVPRERFVPNEQQAEAYADRALPIGSGQTISQPYIVALMTAALDLTGTETVLEIGTGSGYQTAILAQLCRLVVTVERLPELAAAAERLLRDLGCTNVDYRIGDGTLGWPREGGYDGILAAAAAPQVPPALAEQLALGGRLVIPIGGWDRQVLQVWTRTREGLVSRDLCPCAFVKLIGVGGWPAETGWDDE